MISRFQLTHLDGRPRRSLDYREKIMGLLAVTAAGPNDAVD